MYKSLVNGNDWWEEFLIMVLFLFSSALIKGVSTKIDFISSYEIVVVINLNSSSITIILPRNISQSETTDFLRKLRDTIHEINKNINILEIFSDRRDHYLEKFVLGKFWINEHFPSNNLTTISSQLSGIITKNFSNSLFFQDEDKIEKNSSEIDKISSKTKDKAILHNINVIDILEELDNSLKPFDADDLKIIKKI